MKINNIDELLCEYEGHLSEDEINAARAFFECTESYGETIVVLEAFKSAAHGITTGKIDPKALEFINEKMAVFIILRVINKEHSFYETLPIEIKDELIDCYKEHSDKEDFKNRLYKILNMEAEQSPKEIAQVNIDLPKNDNDKVQASLRGKLKYYMKIIEKDSKKG